MIARLAAPGIRIEASGDGVARPKSALTDDYRDGFEGKRFHFLLANPPCGVEWKDQKAIVEREHKNLGFAGRQPCRWA